jgi:hypothetical protein
MVCKVAAISPVNGIVRFSSFSSIHDLNTHVRHGNRVDMRREETLKILGMKIRCFEIAYGGLW